MVRRALAIVALLLVAGACAGRDFTRLPPDSLAVGKTGEAEIRQKLGTPYREGTVVKNNETMKVLTYTYTTTAASPPGGLVPARAQELYFWGDALIGHHFTSSFGRDRTDFDIAKVPLIKKGETTESAVVTLLGPPHGAYRYPLIGDKEGRAAVYVYEETKGTAFNVKLYRQILVVQFDAGGVVKEVEFTASGQR